MAAQLNPTTRKAANITETIIKDMNSWQENLIKYANDNNYKMQEIAELLRQKRSYLEKYAPDGMLDKAEQIINDLKDKQDNNISRGSSSNSAGPASQKGRYKIVPLKKEEVHKCTM